MRRAARHRLAYVAMRIGAGLIALLPEPLMRRSGQMAGLLWWATDRRRRRMARRHMQRVGSPDPGTAARGMFVSYGRYWAETLWVRPRRLPEMGARFTCDGLEHLRAAKESGEGAVLALPHLGNWEAAALVAAGIELPVVAVAERLGNRHITEWFTAQRAMFGIDVVLTGAGNSIRRRLAEEVRQGKAVALLSDRDLSGRGVEVEFWGERTTLPAGPASLAARTGAVLLPIGVYFHPGAGHHASIGPPLRVDEDRDSKDWVAATTQALADVFEELIARDPSQWHLFQPNWPSDRDHG